MSRVARSAVLLTAILVGACGPASIPVPSPPTQSIPLPTQIGSSLPPCPSMSATGCDRTTTQAIGRGSSVCQGKGPGTITASPIALNDLAYVQPMG